jgi:hypothetical protein
VSLQGTYQSWLRLILVIFCRRYEIRYKDPFAPAANEEHVYLVRYKYEQVLMIDIGLVCWSLLDKNVNIHFLFPLESLQWVNLSMSNHNDGLGTPPYCYTLSPVQ